MSAASFDRFAACFDSAGVHRPRPAEPARWRVRPLARCPGEDLQHGEDGLPQVRVKYNVKAEL